MTSPTKPAEMRALRPNYQKVLTELAEKQGLSETRMLEEMIAIYQLIASGRSKLVEVDPAPLKKVPPGVCARCGVIHSAHCPHEPAPETSRAASLVDPPLPSPPNSQAEPETK